MKKVYKLEDLECANCAAKIEDGVRKIQGVEKVTVSFLSQKMAITADEADHDRILIEAKKIVERYEPDVKVIS